MPALPKPASWYELAATARTTIATVPPAGPTPIARYPGTRPALDTTIAVHAGMWEIHCPGMPLHLAITGLDTDTARHAALAHALATDLAAGWVGPARPL